jgi:hypothetical protein
MLPYAAGASAVRARRGGRQVASDPGSRATDTAVRGFWQGYREIVGFQGEGYGIRTRIP